MCDASCYCCNFGNHNCPNAAAATACCLVRGAYQRDLIAPDPLLSICPPLSILSLCPPLFMPPASVCHPPPCAPLFCMPSLFSCPPRFMPSPLLALPRVCPRLSMPSSSLCHPPLCPPPSMASVSCALLYTCEAADGEKGSARVMMAILAGSGVFLLNFIHHTHSECCPYH